MATRKQWQGEKIIEADNGLGWSRKRGSSALSILPGVYEAEIFGIAYKLQKFDGAPGERGWYLYCLADPTHFWGEFCAANLFPAIDTASEMIARGDLRGEGYERKEKET